MGLFSKSPITVRHELSGRIRFRIAGLGQDDAARLDALKSTAGVAWVDVNPACSSLAVGFDPETVSRDALVARVWSVFAPETTEAPAAKASPPACAPAPGTSCACAAAETGAVAKAARRFAGVSAVMGVTFVRTTVLGGTVAQTAFSPLGIAALFFGLPLIRSGYKKIKKKKLDLDGFLGAGTAVAVAAGEALTAFEILWINSGAELLTAWTAERSRKSISQILDMTSHHTFVLIDGVEVEREVGDVRDGDTVVLHTGEKISVDGEIIKGEAILNEAPITGRREFSHKALGDEVFAGTFVREGVIHVLAANVGDQTYLARVMHKVQSELESRAPIEGEADRLAAILVKLGLGVTAMTFLLTGSAWRAFTVLLVMACPCATSLAASTAVSASISAAAKNRILIKGGRYLEEAGSCDVVCFDKTGTLTTHEPVVRELAPAKGVSEHELLKMACSAEAHNHHPLAQAIKLEASRFGVEPIPHTVCDYRMGMGIMAEIQGDQILVGSAKLAKEYGVPALHDSEAVGAFQKRGLTVLHVFKNGEPQGLIGLDALVRPESANVVRRLRSMGVRRLLLVTGDEESSARRLAERLSVDEYFASIMPEDKAVIVTKTMDAGGKVLMVGDGVNDTLALAKADVGAAMGKDGAEAAVESADITLADDSLEALADVYGLSQWTIRVVRQNFWIATGSNVIGVALGAMGLLSPVAAGLIHIAHTLGVVANSSRLLSFKTTTTHAVSTVRGDVDGFQLDGASAPLSGSQAPHSGTDSDSVSSVDSAESEGAAPGETKKRPRSGGKGHAA